jgi:hypothetical protein
MRRGQQRECERGQRYRNVRNDEHAPARQPIRDDAGQRRQEQDRYGAGRSDEAELERGSVRRAGHARYEETRGGELHPRAEIRSQESQPQ